MSIVSPLEQHKKIALELAGMLDSSAVPSMANAMVRVEKQIPLLDPLEWLAAQRAVTQYYWHDRDDAFEMAGVGEADVLSPSRVPPEPHAVIDEIRRRLSTGGDLPRYYGGFRFEPTRDPGGRWREFVAYRFVAPLVEICRDARGTRLAVNLYAVPGQSPAEVVERARQYLCERIVFSENTRALPLPTVVQREDRPDRAGWFKMLGEAAGAFDRGELRKVVLARETCFTATEPFDPVAVLCALARQTENAFLFCFHPSLGRAFLGASPERLLLRRDNRLHSEAIAGTRPRAADPAEDAALGQALLESAKDRREHALVVEALRGHFARLCGDTREDETPSLLELRHCRHLATRFEGLLRDGVTDADILAALHPTPAVGGTPTDRALAFIAREEPFDRGTYAGPVGWVSASGAEFCVGIRSGQVRGNELAVYNGAGIVPGSDPGDEWNEIETKMENFLRAVGLSHGGQECEKKDGA
jgi:menaquinone-specific isochorismate synthase